MVRYGLICHEAESREAARLQCKAEVNTVDVGMPTIGIIIFSRRRQPHHITNFDRSEVHSSEPLRYVEESPLEVSGSPQMLKVPGLSTMDDK